MRIAVPLLAFRHAEMEGLENYVRHVLGALDARHRLTIFATEGQAAHIRDFAPRAHLDFVEDRRAGLTVAPRLATSDRRLRRGAVGA